MLCAWDKSAKFYISVLHSSIHMHFMNIPLKKKRRTKTKKNEKRTKKFVMGKQVMIN